MKSKQIILFIIITFLPTLLFAKEWQLTIQAKAKQINGLCKSSVIIGEAKNANTTPAAPLPPKYSCEIHSTLLPNISKSDEGRRIGLNVSLKNIVLKMQKLAEF